LTLSQQLNLGGQQRGLRPTVASKIAAQPEVDGQMQAGYNRIRGEKK
jgi:hypothetical protein